MPGDIPGVFRRAGHGCHHWGKTGGQAQVAADGGEDPGWRGELGRLRGELDDLRARSAARAIRERATGILMERLDCGAEEARAQLSHLAAEAGRDPASVAADIAGERLEALPGHERPAAARADVALAAALDAAGLAEALLAEALSAEGAAAVAVWALAPDGGIELAGEAGFGPREAARWRRIPPDVPSLPLRVVQADKEIWWPAGQPAGDGGFMIGQPGVARAVVPLSAAGVRIGALEACWPRALADFPAAARRLLPAMAPACAQALTAGIAAADYTRAWADQDASEAERLAALLEAVQWLGNAGGWEENLRTGQVHWTPPTFALFGLSAGQQVPLARLADHVPAADIPAVELFSDRLLRRQEPATAAFRIIRGDDSSVRQLRAFAQPVTGPAGDVVAVRGAYQDISSQYHTQAAFSATREQLAGTEEHLRAEHQLAVRLQEAITPEVSRPVEAAGINVAARYRPASDDHLVGGDWYDAALLPDKNVLLVVGDVAGHGIGAVTGMVALRNCLRGLAVTGAGPDQLLTWLNTAAFHLIGVMATAICAIYDPAARTLRWAKAGHLPPLLIRDEIARAVPSPRGLMLGADPDATYEEATVSLRLGDALLFFTDGLIERRGQSIDDGLARLEQIASRPAADVGQLASRLLAGSSSDTGDDTCLVAVAIR
jgi:serine phosphatase RsbU (regulator of sigma subunit)/PAS domain-containing protein